MPMPDVTAPRQRQACVRVGSSQKNLRTDRKPTDHVIEYKRVGTTSAMAPRNICETSTGLAEIPRVCRSASVSVCFCPAPPKRLSSTACAGWAGATTLQKDAEGISAAPSRERAQSGESGSPPAPALSWLASFVSTGRCSAGVEQVSAQRAIEFQLSCWLTKPLQGVASCRCHPRFSQVSVSPDARMLSPAKAPAGPVPF